MNKLLDRILDAHGGLDCWNRYEKIEATIVSGGGFLRLKGVPRLPTPRRMNVWLREERSSVFPYGAPDERTIFTPDKIAIEKLDGTTIAERRIPRDSFAGHQMSSPGIHFIELISTEKPCGRISRHPSFSQCQVRCRPPQLNFL